MKYAVINLSGTQYKVEENQVVTTNFLNLKDGETSSTDQVLLISEDEKVTVGNPTIPQAIVEFKIIKSYSGKKVKVFKYKAKSRYRKTMGFRPQQTDIQISKISVSAK
jgi:large subunit ribosomal protein L21